jgi:iron complex transport system substrate-binding protein
MTIGLLVRPSGRVSAPREVLDAATRREFIAVLAATGLLTACGDSADTDGGATSVAGTRAVIHPLGETEVPVAPTRVVAATGTVELDVLVALGITPVAAAELETGVGFSSQVADQLDGTVMLGTRRDINLEAIAAQQPDLILGTIGWLQDLYPELSGIAPTVPIDDSQGWRDVTRQVAEAVGRQERAEEVVAAVDGRVDGLVAAVGGDLQGLTYTLMVSFASAGEYGLYRLPDDVDALLQRLGMVRPQQQLDLFGPDEYYAAMSLEQVDIIDTDVIFLFAYDDAESAAEVDAARQNPLFASLSAAQADRVFVVDSDHWYFATPQAIEQVVVDLQESVLPTLQAGGSSALTSARP